MLFFLIRTKNKYAKNTNFPLNVFTECHIILTDFVQIDDPSFLNYKKGSK